MMQFMLGFIFGMLISAILAVLTIPNYRDGQVDALTGHLKYHLVTQPDSTKTWEYIKK